MDVNKIARAIETDAGHALPGLRESLAQAKAGDFLRVHTPEQIVARRRGRPQEAGRKSPKRRLNSAWMQMLWRRSVRAGMAGKPASMRLCGRR